MRQHYRSKISIVRVNDLQHLIDLNYRIDAADHQIHQSTTEPYVRRPINQVEVAREDSEDEELQETMVNHIRGRQQNIVRSGHSNNGIIPHDQRNVETGADFWDAFGIKPMIDMGKGPEYLETVPNRKNESMCFTIEPTDQVPETKEEEEDDTLDIPVFEGPTEAAPDPESVETEHELSADEREQLLRVIKGFELTSTGKLGRTHLIEHEIVLKEGATPRNPAMYKCSPYMQEAIRKEVERFKSLDAIEECYSEWTNPLVPVPKKNGKVRNIGGVYRFKVLPFGVINAPFTMSRLMNKALGFDLEPRVFVYLDDIVIATETLEEHLRLLRIVGERLRQAGLTISLEKSRFCRKQVMYLGYLLNEHGVAIDSSRIQPVLDYARPKTQEDIRRLMGLAGFYQRFVKDYSRVTAPITDLLTKENKSLFGTMKLRAHFAN
ncbi:uncharacterized protein LOC134207072 [Armigeres subalbatus]|uniref:uncharacterized protein LOC134207072 n=1 Tax=Armigeres subalbatus TaxID=124917 RepID=UPI002ED28BDB